MGSQIPRLDEAHIKLGAWGTGVKVLFVDLISHDKVIVSRCQSATSQPIAKED